MLGEQLAAIRRDLAALGNHADTTTRRADASGARQDAAQFRADAGEAHERTATSRVDAIEALVTKDSLRIDGLEAHVDIDREMILELHEAGVRRSVKPCPDLILKATGLPALHEEVV